MTLDSQLVQLENAELIRQLSEDEPAYLFKHALTQDSAYQSLLKQTRHVLHRRVAETIEQIYADRLDEYATLLAQHFELAEQDARALEYLIRASEWAHRSFSLREEIDLLARAINIAERTGQRERAAELHAQRGKAFSSLTGWQNARPELESALAELSPSHVELRAEVLAELAIVNHWLLDVPGTRRYANEALALAEQLGRTDLAVGATCALALAESSDGLLQDSLANFDRAFALAADSHSVAVTMGREVAGAILYWTGQYDRAVERNREAARFAYELHDSATFMRALGNLGIALMSQGRYAEALDTFHQVRQFGRRQGIETWTARAIAMESGCHLEVFDFAGAERLAEEAREMARSSNFIGPVVSAGIDLLFNYTRRHDPARALRLLPEVADQVERGKGSHGWLWRLRFAQVRAELALAQEKWEEAIRAADEALERSRATGRTKYLTLALATRGRALIRSGQTEPAFADLRAAVSQARELKHPAIFLVAAEALGAVRADDQLAAEARQAAHHIATSLPTLKLRDNFEAFVSELF